MLEKVVRLGARPLARTFHSSVPVAVGYRSEGWWFKDHKPKNYPKNEEQRKAAAVRYGLREEDYKPDKSDYVLFGDYPDLGTVRHGHRDPFENHYDPRYRRNFGEPVPIWFLSWLPERHTDTGIEKLDKSWKIYLTILVTNGAFLALFSYLFYFTEFIYSPELMPEAYPYDYDQAGMWEDPRSYPLEYYTFEPANSQDK